MAITAQEIAKDFTAGLQYYVEYMTDYHQHKDSSPSDKDVYMRPNINYKVADNLAVEAGANIFFGDYPGTFFGQFRNDTNLYTALRYSF